MSGYLERTQELLRKALKAQQEEHAAKQEAAEKAADKRQQLVDDVAKHTAPR